MAEDDLVRLLGKLTPLQKTSLLIGADTWRTRPEPAAGLGALIFSDGPAGVRGEAWDERDTSALLPCASALGAMWDDSLVERLGGLLAAEARRKSVHVVLAPTLNLHRSPLAGRHFECFAEDPLLAGRAGAALIRGIQAQGVAATAKHYVANDSETERLTVDVRVAERALREVYLAPFEAAVEAGVWLVMSGYNGVNGTTMTENALRRDPLKSEWGFDGTVISDWGAVRTTVASALAGPGVLLRVLDAKGAELYAERRLGGRQLEPPLVRGAHTVELSALLLPETAGEWTFGVAGFGGMTLTVDGRTVVQGDFPVETDDPAVIHVDPPPRYGRAVLAAGQEVHVTARRRLAPGTGRATVLTAGPPPPDPEAALADAVRAARDADVAVVCVGTTQDSESEGHDRSGLALPGSQDALVRAVAEANPRTVVVVNAGAPVEMPLRDRVAAVLLTWFPGQEGGSGVADVLFGRAEPGGRLPTTWGARLADTPVADTRPRDGVLRYDEGLHIGHRAWARSGREPAYWFGHGLGYTTWRYETIAVREDADAFAVDVRIRNTGDRPGREVVQVYLARPGSAVDRPVRWLAGYVLIQAAAGEAVTATVSVTTRALRHWSTDGHRWEVEPGEYEVLVGRSAGDLPLSAVLGPVLP